MFLYKGLEKLESSADFHLNKIGSGHTFGYKNLHYNVNDLVDYFTNVNPIKIQTIKTPIDMLRSTEAAMMWGSLDKKSKTISPLTLYGLIDHIERINRADMRYPIIILKEENKFTSLDGLHRIMKAALNDIPTIQARVVNIHQMQQFVDYIENK